jgi:serine protease Do
VQAQDLHLAKTKKRMNNEQIQEWIERYHLGEMSVEEREHFEASLEESAELRRLYREHKAFVRMVNHQAAKQLVQTQLASIKAEQSGMVKRISNSMQVHVNKYWKIASVAASVAVLASVGTAMFTKNYYQRAMTSQMQELYRKTKKDMNAIAVKQNALDSTIEQIIPEQPEGDERSAGTCFALNNNGYAITNAHVVNKGSQPYIFTADNIGHKAKVVSINRELDVAVLKVIDDEVRFSKVYDVPYTVGNYTSNMAENVFTVGYPKNSIVYNRGYISSESGRDDDSSRYQLELPSSPGVSGSPVFDAKGNVIAVINSKESIGVGITYALKSSKLKQYLNDVDSLKLNPSSKMPTLSQSEQLKMLKEFVLVVKVY